MKRSLLGLGIAFGIVAFSTAAADKPQLGRFGGVAAGEKAGAVDGRAGAAHDVHRLDAALDNPFIHATGMVQTTDHPDLPGMRVLGNPIRLDGKRLPTRAAPVPPYPGDFQPWLR